MRKLATLITLAALLVLTALGATAASSPAAGSGNASLRLLDRDPLTVRGLGFKSRERVRVSAYVPGLTRTTIRATATGTFRAVFSAITLDRCSQVRVVATGTAAQGSQAVLKILPQPMCAPQRSP